MKTDNSIIEIDRLCSINPKTVQIPSHIDEKTLFDFVNFTRSVLERVEGEMVFFDISKIHSVVLCSVAKLLHKIEEAASPIGLPDIHHICRQSVCMLNDCNRVPVETLRSVKNWLWQVTEHIVSLGNDKHLT